MLEEHVCFTAGRAAAWDPLCLSINKPQPDSEEGRAASWQLLRNGSWARRCLFGDHLLGHRQPGAQFRAFVVIFPLVPTSLIDTDLTESFFSD